VDNSADLSVLAGTLVFGGPEAAVTTTCHAREPAAPPDPAMILSQLDIVYEGDLSVCPEHAACGEAITNAGKIADAMVRIVDENLGIANGEKIASAAGDLGETVDTATKAGCYGLGTPAAAPDVLAELCGGLAQSAELQWMALSAAADGI
jgi:hypothetical protein